jgi:hypothetical protein
MPSTILFLNQNQIDEISDIKNMSHFRAVHKSAEKICESDSWTALSMMHFMHFLHILIINTGLNRAYL